MSEPRDMDPYFTGYVVWSAEGTRLAAVTCKQCHAAVLLARESDPQEHLSWHERTERPDE